MGAKVPALGKGDIASVGCSTRTLEKRNEKGLDGYGG